ncbi:MAG TPA: S9 family peptidase [Actinomycetota bacterium]
MTPGVAPYGSWRSPIGADLVAKAGVVLYEPWATSDGFYWLELRPDEGGRNVVVRGDPFGSPVDLTPPDFDVRTKVHEYGGGSYLVHEATVWFSNFADQRLYRQEVAGEPRPVTPAPPAPGSIRYADGRITPDGRRIVSVRERHEGDDTINELVAVPADGSGAPHVLASGRDFYAFPRIAPDGSSLAWVEWDHPNMPWDDTELHVATFGDDGSLSDERTVAGGRRESIFQPEWSPDGVLHFVSDRTGWWNLYRLREEVAENLVPMAAEFGVPMWEFGYSSYAFLSDGRIALLYRQDGVHHLSVLDPVSGELVDLDVPFSCFDPPYVRATGMQLVFVGGGPATPHQVVALDFVSRGVEVLRESERTELDPAYFSVPLPIEFSTEGGVTAHAYHYPPASPDFTAPAGERPPLIVHVHGGPTSESTPEFSLMKQFWTSRGFAVLDVNYGGSTGYGRDYRERLYGQWGVVDVHDAVAAARFLVERGEADAERLLIRGGSAGGYTTVCALTWHDEFAAGASYFGLVDLEPFADSTHKFELRYTDNLVGPWPEAIDLWRARSPIHSFDLLARPLLILQGLEDEVVPPDQAEAMVHGMQARGLPYAYLAFEGEQHGFRKAENIQRSLEAELAFYARVLGIELPEPVPELEIHNL